MALTTEQIRALEKTVTEMVYVEDRLLELLGENMRAHAFGMTDLLYDVCKRASDTMKLAESYLDEQPPVRVAEPLKDEEPL